MIKLLIRYPLMLCISFMYIGIQQYKGQENLDTNIVGDELLTGVNFDFNSCAFTTFIYPEILSDSSFFGEKHSVCDMSFFHFNNFDFDEDVLSQKGYNKILVQTFYENGIKVKVIGRYEDSLKFTEVNFSSKGREGVVRRWHRNGQLESIYTCSKGEIISSIIDFYESGQIRSNIYKYGEINSEFGEHLQNSIVKKWFKNGQLAQEYYRIDSNSIRTTVIDYYRSGELFAKGIYSDGEQEYKMYWENGTLARKGKMIDFSALRIGKWEEWHENGVLKLESYYHDSIPNYALGTWKLWNEKGELIKEEVYEKNELIDIKEYLPLKMKKD